MSVVPGDRGEEDRGDTVMKRWHFTSTPYSDVLGTWVRFEDAEAEIEKARKEGKADLTLEAIHSNNLSGDWELDTSIVIRKINALVDAVNELRVK